MSEFNVKDMELMGDQDPKKKKEGSEEFDPKDMEELVGGPDPREEPITMDDMALTTTGEEVNKKLDARAVKGGQLTGEAYDNLRLSADGWKWGDEAISEMKETRLLEIMKKLTKGGVDI